jgi:O-acetyl-ADP-ribose deacetylase (regulator of RNase III)
MRAPTTDRTDTQVRSQLAAVEQDYRGTKISVATGDITGLQVDALVNPANSQLVMGGGVAGAILRAGGDQIQKEALKKAPIPVGKAIATTAGKLKAKYVIHAPTMTRPAMATIRENVKLATRAALECARQLNANSVAFPGMGTGVGGLDLEEATEVMIAEIKKHVDSGSPLKNIILVGFNADLKRAFERSLQKSLS